MRHLPLRRGVVSTAALVAAIALVAGCGGSGSSSDAADGAGDQPFSIKLGYFPLVHTATAVHAAETGIFEQAGLDVELLATAGGAQAVPSMMAGEYDITYGNYTSALLAAQKGLPIRIIAGNDVGADDHGIMVNEDSDLRSPADLEGKTVAVNNLQNIGTVAINAVVEAAGADPASVKKVELPFPDMQAVLDRGDVDAIWQVEPFKASSLANGDRELFPLFSGPVKGMPVAGWLTTEQFVRENPEAVAAFRKALATSVEQLADDRERLVELVPTFTKVPAEVVEQIALPQWDAATDTEQLTKMSDLMLDYGIISEKFDVTTILTGSAG